MGLEGYVLLGEVGSGSTGRVFRARQEALDREVAVKALDPDLAADEAFRERFRAEARVLAGLRDPHIATLYEYVEDSSGAWIVQQWVNGAPLELVVASHGPLAAEQAVGVVRGALIGLAVAHRAGVVHGDVSTGNILVTGDGVSTLVDFGLAAPSGSPGVGGTAAFVSPEAAAGGALTFRSDVYSACKVLDRLLGDDRGELAAVLRRGLAVDPSDRPADAAELLALLEEAAELRFGAGWLARASVAGVATATLAMTAASGPSPQPHPATMQADGAAVPARPGTRLGTGRGRLAAVGVASALVVAAAATAFAVTTAGSGAEPAGAPASAGAGQPVTAPSTPSTVDQVQAYPFSGRYTVSADSDLSALQGLGCSALAEDGSSIITMVTDSAWDVSPVSNRPGVFVVTPGRALDLAEEGSGWTLSSSQEPVLCQAGKTLVVDWELAVQPASGAVAGATPVEELTGSIELTFSDIYYGQEGPAGPPATTVWPVQLERTGDVQ